MRRTMNLTMLSLSLVCASVEAQDGSFPPAPTGNVPFSVPQLLPSQGSAPAATFSAPSSTYPALREQPPATSGTSPSGIMSPPTMSVPSSPPAVYPSPLSMPTTDARPSHSLPYSGSRYPMPSYSAPSYAMPYSGPSYMDPYAPPAYDYDVYGSSNMMMNPTGGAPAYGAGIHGRYPFFSYRAPWYTPGPVSRNVTIVW